MGLKLVRGVWCDLAVAGSVNRSVGIGRTKKERDAPGSGLRWPPFGDYKQQST
jgi:hypothetical protein